MSEPASSPNPTVSPTPPSHGKTPVLEKENITAPDEDGEDQVKVRNPMTYQRKRRPAIVDHSARDLDSSKEIEVYPKSEDTKLKLREIIKSNFLFSRLDKTQRQIVIDAMFEVKKTVGDIIIKQGDSGDNFYIIDSGEVDVLISPAKGEPANKVAHLGAPQAFGELALMHGCPRAATIQATTECVLWALGRSTFRRVMMDTVLNKRAKYQDFIAKVPFFNLLEKYERQTLCDALTPQECEADTVIVQEGDIGARFYIIEEGEVVVLRTLDPAKGPEEVNRLKPPQFFGEMALISDEARRLATVQAVTECTFLTLDKNSFERLLGPLKEILMRNAKAYESMLKESK